MSWFSWNNSSHLNKVGYLILGTLLTLYNTVLVFQEFVRHYVNKSILYQSVLLLITFYLIKNLVYSQKYLRFTLLSCVINLIQTNFIVSLTNKLCSYRN